MFRGSDVQPTHRAATVGVVAQISIGLQESVVSGSPQVPESSFAFSKAWINAFAALRLTGAWGVLLKLIRATPIAECLV